MGGAKWHRTCLGIISVRLLPVHTAAPGESAGQTVVSGSEANHAAAPPRLTSCGLCAAYQWDYVFDWTVLKYQQTQASRRPPREPAAIGPGKDDHDPLLQGGNGAGV